MKSNFLLTLALLCISTALYGQDVERYQQKLLGVNEQWHSFQYPLENFQLSKSNLSDVRILKKNSDLTYQEIPYILNILSKKEQTQNIAFTLINQTKKNNRYYYTYKVPENTTLNEIRLEIQNQNYDWRVEVEGSHNQTDWFTIAENSRILSIKTDDTEFEYNTLKFPTINYAYIRLNIDSDGKKPNISRTFITNNAPSLGVLNSYKIQRVHYETDTERKQSVLTFFTEFPVPVSELSLDFETKTDFYRPFSISYLIDSLETDKGVRYVYRHLTTGILNSREPSAATFSPIITNGFKLIIRNYDNQPLSYNSVLASGPAYEFLARFTGTGDYYLSYGDKSLHKPKYDINYFEDSIPDSVSSISVDKEREVISKEAETKPLGFLDNSLLLWLVLGFGILLLGWFSFKMMS